MYISVVRELERIGLVRFNSRYWMPAAGQTEIQLFRRSYDSCLYDYVSTVLVSNLMKLAKPLQADNINQFERKNFNHL